MDTDTLTAHLIERQYTSTSKTFWTVQCNACGSVLNSGHHYTGSDGEYFAARLAADHNRENHPS